MPSPTRAAIGNLAWEGVIKITISPASIGPSTSAEQTFTVPGLQLGDFVEINKPTAQAGLGIGNSRVSAANTLAVVFINASASTVTPTANEVYLLSVERPENVDSTGLPSLTSVS
jgi:hypothetical protein